MKDVGRLVSAICDVFRLALPDPKRPARRALFEPFFAEGSWQVYSFQAFNQIAMRMGHPNFDRRESPMPTETMYAAAIIRQMLDPHGLWTEVDPATAQIMANEGALVAATLFGGNEPGAICTVMPGVLEDSPSYGEKIPRVMSIGKTVFIGLRVSYAFPAPAKPRYYCLKEDWSRRPAAETL